MVTPGGTQSVTVLEESGIYQLIFGSKLESAERFQDWVFEEVLPSIRKTGRYEVKPQRQHQAIAEKSITDYVEAIKLAPTIDNPIIKSAFEQRLAEELGANNALPGVHQGMDKPVVVTVLAAELGFSLKPGQDSALGKWVKAHHEPLGKAQHGRYVVNVYDPNEIKDTIIEWFAARDAISDMTQSHMT